MKRGIGIPDKGAGSIAKLVFRTLKKKMGCVPPAKRLLAHHTPTLLAATGLDAICASAKTIPGSWKELAQLKVAVMVGCPY